MAYSSNMANSFVTLSQSVNIARWIKIALRRSSVVLLLKHP